VKPVLCVHSWRKLFSDLEEDDFQDFSNEEVKRPETIDLMDVSKEIENIEDCLHVTCEPGFWHVTHADQRNGEDKEHYLGSHGTATLLCFALVIVGLIK
jgi:hypothetical protein